MINNGNVRKHYSNLVPSTVPHKLFWARYFFKVCSFTTLPKTEFNGFIHTKVHLIDQQEVKRQALKRRAEEAKVATQFLWVP